MLGEPQWGEAVNRNTDRRRTAGEIRNHYLFVHKYSRSEKNKCSLVYKYRPNVYMRTFVWVTAVICIFCAHGYANYLTPHGRMSVTVCTRHRVQSMCRASDFAHFAHAGRVLCIISFKPPSHPHNSILSSRQWPCHLNLAGRLYSMPHKTANAEGTARTIACRFKVGRAAVDCFTGLLLPLMFSTTSFLSLIWKKLSPLTLFHPFGYANAAGLIG